VTDQTIGSISFQAIIESFPQAHIDFMSELLALCASFDQRTVGDADLASWLTASRAARWHLPAVLNIVIEHYSADATRPRIKPAVISDRLKALRSAAATSFVPPVIPNGQDPADYPAWHRALLAEHVDRQLHEWVETGVEPVGRAILPDPAGQARVQQIIGGGFRAVPAGGVRSETPPTPTMQPRTAVAVPCPHCGASPGRPCTRSSGASKSVPLRAVHPAREEAAA
jgi:hypothetical protein